MRALTRDGVRADCVLDGRPDLLRATDRLGVPRRFENVVRDGFARLWPLGPASRLACVAV